MNTSCAVCASLWILAGLIVLSGCAGTPVTEPPDAVDVVFSYTPDSEAEAAQQAALDDADTAARLEIETAEAELDSAIMKLRGAIEEMAVAEERAKAGQPPLNRPIPTDEEIEALRTAARTKRMGVELAMIGMIDRYEAFLTSHPDNWYVRHCYAWFLADQLMHYEAAEEWRRVIKDEPRFPFAYNNLGSLYNHMGRDKESIVLYRKAIALYDEDPTFHVNLAVNYFTHRKEAGELYGWDLPRIFEECIAEYRKALALAPTDRQIAYDLASQYVMAKFFNVTDTADRAISDWQYYLTLDLTENQRGMAYRNIGTIYLREKKAYAEAIEWYEKAYALLEDSNIKKLIAEAREAIKGAVSDEQPEP